MNAGAHIEAVAALVAEDLRALAWLHARERSPAVWLGLWAGGFPTALSVLGPQDPAVVAMDQALAALQRRCQQDLAREEDRLAADYAAIYLTHALRASPNESVWRDEDHLMLQAPAFQVREAYRRHGLAVADWRLMADDHLAHELEFVAHLLGRGEFGEALAFLDEHLLCWLPAFAQQVARRADTDIYAGLAVLTGQACLGLRDMLQAQAQDSRRGS